LEDVYRRACLEHPVVGPLFKQQEAAAAAEKAKASTQLAQRAASSIRSRPGSSIRPDQKVVDRKSGLRAIYDQLGGQ
jgi:cytochrome c551/c552